MGLMTILRKVKQREKELRILMLYVVGEVALCTRACVLPPGVI